MVHYMVRMTYNKTTSYYSNKEWLIEIGIILVHSFIQFTVVHVYVDRIDPIVPTSNK